MLGCCVAKFATVIGVIRKISIMGFIVIIVGVGLFIAAKKSAETARANWQKGSLVEWEGDLISASEFSVDFVFKNKSGVKATFEIQKQSSARDSGKIIVIVHFPKDQLEALRKSLRRKTRFSGKLLGVDGLMKKVFLAEGRLS